MNKKKFKILNKADIVIIVVTIILSISLYASFKYFIQRDDATTVYIYYENRLVATMDLNTNDTLLLEQKNYPSLLADLEVEVKDRKVQISKEESPNNICSKQGWTDSQLKPLVCLPNKVMVTVEAGEGEVDNGGIDFEVGNGE